MALLVAMATVARADRRMALIVANGDYKHAPLANPVVDADLVAASLKTLGFAPKVVKNVTLEEFDDAISAFAEGARSADVALFYFAGHGFAVTNPDSALGASNYLMSISADITAARPVTIRAGGLSIDEILKRLSGRAKVTLVFIDACRQGLAGRGGAGGRGFARFDAFVAQPLFVGMSTRLGAVADDGRAGKGSPFARAFAARIAARGVRIDDVFRRVRAAVLADTGGEQAPEVVEDDLPDGAMILAATEPPLPTRTVPTLAPARVAKSSALDSKGCAAPPKPGSYEDLSAVGGDTGRPCPAGLFNNRY